MSNHTASCRRPEDWQRIKRLGLAPGVSADTYAKRVMSGLYMAQSVLATTKETIPTIETVQGIHYIIFGGVHPAWAGTFRQPGQEVQVGNLMCTPAKDVMREMKDLHNQMAGHPLSGNQRYRAAVVSYYHATFLAIHPFADGNGRVARTILDFQMRRMLGHRLSCTIRPDEYGAALVRAQQHDDLSLLAGLVLRDDLRQTQTVDQKRTLQQSHGASLGGGEEWEIQRPGQRRGR